MSILHSRFLTVAASLVLAGSLIAACEEEGPAEKAGEQMDKAAESTEDAVKDTAEEAESKMDKAAEETEDAAKEAEDSTSNMMDQAQEKLEEAGEAIEETVTEAKEAIEDAVSGDEKTPAAEPK